MAIDQHLLEILRCPATGQALRQLTRRELEILNQAIAKDGLPLESGARISTRIDDGLMTHDGSHVYRIDDGIPVMLISEAVRAGELLVSGA